MHPFNVISRRSFFERSAKVGIGLFLSTLVDIPLVVKRALAQNGIGTNGKKVLFIFFRGGNDGLNAVIPILDSAYYTSRPIPTGGTPGNIGIPMDPIVSQNPNYYAQLGACDFFPTGAGETYGSYPYAMRLGNGFAALHPSLRFLAPIYNAGQLALLHRTAYPKQSQSHFDSQNYWENGNPNNNLSKDGIFYRAILASGLAHTSPLTGVSIQSSLPLLLRGSEAAMTNLSDVSRYDLLGIPASANLAGTNGNLKAEMAIRNSLAYPFPAKNSRDLLALQYQNLMGTLPLFEGIKAELDVHYTDNENTDGDYPYVLFPYNNDSNGGYVRTTSPRVVDADKYVVPANQTSYDFLKNLKAAALVLNRTPAIIAGTQIDGFDTHQLQGGVTGAQANLFRRVAWGIYALRKYFMTQADKVTWDNMIIVTLTEFGRTTVMNSDLGTDHAVAGVMFIAGGGVKGYGRPGSPNGTGVFGCSPNDPIPWITGPANQGGNANNDGSMFGVSNRYLKRIIDYRSVLGEIIRKHLGATDSQIASIIPGYADAREKLRDGGTSDIDGVPILGEVGFL